METLLEKKPIGITHKLSLMSLIVPYFGYVNECAELMLQLDSKTRAVWLGNLKAILEVIMDYRQCTLVKEIHKTFTQTISKKLQQGKNYLYFALKVKLGSEESFKAMIKLMDQMEEVMLKYQFEEVLITMEECAQQIGHCFLQKYVEKGFDKKAIVLNSKKSVNKGFNSQGFYLKYHYYDPCEKKIGSYTNDIYRSNRLPNKQAIEKLYVYDPKSPMSHFLTNFKSISITPEALTSPSSEVSEYQFKNESCKTLELSKKHEYDEIEMESEKVEIVFQALEEFSKKILILESFSTQYSHFFEFIASQNFFQENEDYQNLSKIKNFTFESEVDHDRISLDYKCQKGEIAYQNSVGSSIKIFTVSDLELKLMTDEFCYDPEHQVIILMKAPSVLSFKNIKICKDYMHIAKLSHGVEGRWCLKLSTNDKILMPQEDVPMQEDFHSWRRMIKFSMVTYKTILSCSRPHYILNAFVEPDESDILGADKVCKLHLAPIIKSLSDIPQNGVVSIYIHTYFLSMNYYGWTQYRITNPDIYQRNHRGKIAKEITRIDASEELCELFEGLKEVNLYEFRCESIIDDDKVVQKLCELCECNHTIRDIELNLVHAVHAKRILESLNDNYVIKTVRLMTEEAIKIPPKNVKPIKTKKPKKNPKIVKKPESAESMQLYNEIITYCDEFRSKRLGTEIMLNTTHKKYKPWEKKGFQLSYK
ncbi:unnamed protein product [Moneuplotes crassus]|uniref:Uncharacterized protein n=1 Tax=Euplotes crassus TaxID=5936 RepID=A0AAD1U0Y5_EUPCR|nr:unnamed protein product [Moneuplotes crassus]